MSKRPDNIITLSETLSLCEYKSGLAIVTGKQIGRAHV